MSLLNNLFKGREKVKKPPQGEAPTPEAPVVRKKRVLITEAQKNKKTQERKAIERRRKQRKAAKETKRRQRRHK